jgi:poly(hydroxyalkanoate) granule associated protein phasin
MTTRKKSSPRGRRTRAASAPPAPATRLRETWEATVQALGSAEAEAERRLRRLLARNRIEPADARTALLAFRARVAKERRKAAREIETRLSAVQVRLQHERKNLGRTLGEAVRGTLAALNIPSRREVSELTRKVDELTRKLDGYRRAPVRRRAGAGSPRKPAAA